MSQENVERLRPSVAAVNQGISSQFSAACIPDLEYRANLQAVTGESGIYTRTGGPGGICEGPALGLVLVALDSQGGLHFGADERRRGDDRRLALFAKPVVGLLRQWRCVDVRRPH